MLLLSAYLLLQRHSQALGNYRYPPYTHLPYKDISTPCNGENFTRILNSIRILKEKAEIEEFRVGLNFVITLDNYKEIIQATKLAREAEAHYIRFEPEFYSALAHETIYTKIEEINSMLEKAKKLQTKEFEVSIPKLNRGAMTNTDSVEGDFKVCHYCNFVTALGADGSMYPCPQIHLNEKYCMGNAINDGYSKWIQSKDKENWYRKNRDRKGLIFNNMIIYLIMM